MSFTVQEVLDAAKAGMDEVLESNEAITAINEALGWLGDRAYEDKEVDLYITGPSLKVRYPDDCIKVEAVEGAGGKFTVRGQYIYLDTPGTYTLRYRAVPPMVKILSDRVPVHEIYRSPLITYLRSWAKLHDDDESVEGNNLRQLAMQDFQTAFSQLRRAKVGPSTVRLQRGVVQG